MKDDTLRRVRRFCRFALQAAPLALASCTPKGPTGATGGTPTVEMPPPEPGVGPDPVPVPIPPPESKECKLSPPDVTGCGGAEVAVLSSLESCNLPREGDLPPERCPKLCGGFDTSSCSVYAGDEGKPRVFCHAMHPCKGRAPAGLRTGRPRRGGIEAYLAHAQRLEALSVDAFDELGAELTRWGAPAQLRQACHRAAADETRHADAMGELLRARGRRPRAIGARKHKGFRSLEALARHNEKEGVVGETWGALLAAHQAAHAGDRQLRRAMRAIAREEMEHAALSLRIAAWARRKLGPGATRRLDRERARAVARLCAGAGPFPAEDRDNTLGWPSRSATASLLASLAAFLA